MVVLESVKAAEPLANALCEGGLFCASLKGFDSQRMIEFAVAASCLKHSIEGDFNMVSLEVR